MRVAYTFVSMPVGGAEDFALSIARNLPADWEPVFVCLRSLGAIGEELACSSRPPHLVRVSRTKRLSLTGIWQLSRWFKTNRIDLVHSQTYHSHIYAIPAARLAGIPSVLHQQKTLEGLKWHRDLLMRLVTGMASAVVTLSAKTANDFRQHFRIPRSKITVIPNVVDLAEFHPAQHPSEGKVSVGFPPEIPLIGAIASFSEVKNHPLTIRMLSQLHEAGIPFRAVLLGDGKLRPQLTTLSRESGLENRLTLPGAQRPIGPWVRALDLLVHPSSWEGQPLILLQAVASGVPIIASRIEGNLAALGDHPGLFDLANSDEYLAMVRRVLQDQTFRAQIVSYQERLQSTLLSATDGAMQVCRLYDRLTGPR